MESTQELQHWGIKGQRWGIRRYQNPDGSLTEAGKKRYYYQNPDGSLTEAGKKDYMKAAKKGKLDVSKLSDNDLNMINSRFAREKTFKQNVSDYEKSTFKYRLKEAALARIKGSGGGGGGKGKGGGSGIAKMLAIPIKKAFEEAFKDSPSGSGKDDGYDEDSKWWRDVSNKGHRFTEKYFDPEKRPGIEHTKKDIERGKKHMNFVVNEMSGGRMGTFDATSGGNSYAEGLVRVAQQKKAEEKARRAAQRDAENRRQKNESKNRRREMDTEERLKKLGFTYASHSAIVIRRNSSDELYHHGIKGQKWGVRRFQNEDGTLTEAGKARIAKIAGFGYLNPSNEDRKKGRTTERDKISNKYKSEYWKAVENGMDENSPSEEGRKLWNKFKTEYASATLKDLKMHDTPQSRKEVKKILAQIDPSYLYSHGNNETNYEKYWERENRRDEKFAARRKQIEHPKRDKVTKTAKNAANAAIKAAPIISAIT